jgi:predicted Holliday junction resolvase-like endonuclease
MEIVSHGYIVAILLNIVAIGFLFRHYKQTILNNLSNEESLKQKEEKLKQDFENWKTIFKSTEIPKIKKQTLDKSRNTIRGIATEHLAPFLQKDYNAKDFRHLGDPVDYIVFHGLSDILDKQTDQIVEVVFLDIKTGNSRLNKVQRRIRDAIKDGRVSFKIYNPDKVEKQS